MLQIIRKSLSISFQPIFYFAKGSRPKAQAKELKQKGKGRAQSDEKSAKISQAEQEEQQKKAQDEIKRRQEQETAKKSQPKMRTWDAFWDEHVDEAELLKLKIAKFPIYYQHIKQVKKEEEEIKPQLKSTVLITEDRESFRRLKKVSPLTAGDITEEFNKKYLKQLSVINYDGQPFASPLRCGAIGIKVGMTATWDQWGHRHALTVIQLDRNQVVQVKTREYDGVDSIQIGAGESNIKTLSKPLIGHYLKNDIPPKRILYEFPITPENKLPVGFMITARHFIPGQLIDVCGTSVGKGWAGTIKKFNFTLQPKSHGNSLSHRSPGSQGNRADPGRVFKGKKMSGRLGNSSKTIDCLTIYKIDADRSLIFVKGSVPGKAGGILYLRDAIKNAHKNEQLLNYPTFIAQEGATMAKQITMTPPEEDPEAREVHENDVIKGEEEE